MHNNKAIRAVEILAPKMKLSQPCSTASPQSNKENRAAEVLTPEMKLSQP